MITKDTFFERYNQVVPLFNDFNKLEEKYDSILGDASKFAHGSLIGVNDADDIGLKQSAKLKGAAWTGRIIGLVLGMIIFIILAQYMKKGKIILAFVIGIAIGCVISSIINKVMLKKIMTGEVKKLDSHLNKLDPIINDAVGICENINRIMIDIPLMYCYPDALKSFFEFFKADRVDDTREAIEMYEKSTKPEGLNSDVADVLKQKMMNSVS